MQAEAPSRSTTLWFSLGYVLFYAFASAADHATTLLALHTAGSHEGNTFSTSSQTYLTTRAWIFTAIGGLVMLGCVVSAFRNARRTDPRWIEHPLHSFGLFYINPWSPSAITRSPIHLLSFAIGFGVLRLLAAGNNLLIHFYGYAPIGSAIQWVAHRSSPTVGFVAIVVPLFYLLGVIFSPLAARLLEAARGTQ